jgi:hypothetical protein
LEEKRRIIISRRNKDPSGWKGHGYIVEYRTERRMGGLSGWKGRRERERRELSDSKAGPNNRTIVLSSPLVSHANP